MPACDILSYDPRPETMHLLSASVRVKGSPQGYCPHGFTSRSPSHFAAKLCCVTMLPDMVHCSVPYLAPSSRIPIGCERRAILLLLYSYTRDIPASSDDIAGRTPSPSRGRNGLSNHVWPEIPVSSHLSPPPTRLLFHGTHGTPTPDGRSPKNDATFLEIWTLRAKLAHV